MKILWTDEGGWHEMNSQSDTPEEAKVELRGVIGGASEWYDAWLITAHFDGSISIEEIES